jgi:anti-sigma B factor antagonist
MAQTVSFSSDKVDDHTEVMTLDGRCDLPAALEAEQRIIAALDAGRTKIVFDLRGVSSLGSAGLAVLFRGQTRTKARSGRFVLIRPNPYVWDLFERSGLDHAFSMFSDLNGALAKTPNEQQTATAA